MTITLDQLTQAVASESLEAACLRQPHFTARVLRSRAEGDPLRDFAHGTLDAVLELPEGKFSLRIRWEAEGQSLAEHGWVCREAPHMNGGGTFSDVAILDENGARLAADADELVGLAYEFFSYQDIESAITPVLPVRPEPEFAPGPDADLFRPWHGRRKRHGRATPYPLERYGNAQSLPGGQAGRDTPSRAGAGAEVQSGTQEIFPAPPIWRPGACRPNASSSSTGGSAPCCRAAWRSALRQHISGRGLRDRNATLWSSFALRGERHAVFFSGDTGLSPAFTDIGRRLGPFDLVMLEVGASHPAWGNVHLGPDNALKAWAQLGSGRFLPVHWGTFNLAMHPWSQPADVLLAQASEELVMPRLGEPVEPARVEAVEPWWRGVVEGDWQDALQQEAELLALPVKD